MIVQCPECRDHYEDTSHAKKCPHNYRQPSALTDHLETTSAARRDYAARGGVPLVHPAPPPASERPTRAALGGRTNADASDDPLPTAP